MRHDKDQVRRGLAWRRSTTEIDEAISRFDAARRTLADEVGDDHAIPRLLAVAGSLAEQAFASRTLLRQQGSMVDSRRAMDPPAGLATWDEVPARLNLDAILIILKYHEFHYAVGREDNLRVQELIEIVLDLCTELGVGGDDPHKIPTGRER